MSNNKQDHIGEANKMVSSVEWSIEQMIALCEDYDDGKINYTDYCNGVKEVKSQANAIHKEEIIKARLSLDRSNMSDFLNSLENATDYYNKTFKSE